MDWNDPTTSNISSRTSAYALNITVVGTIDILGRFAPTVIHRRALDYEQLPTMSISDQCIHTPLNHPDDKGESPQSPEQESETATGHTAEITACMDFLVDQRYQIIKCIGQGAYGVVA